MQEGWGGLGQVCTHDATEGAERIAPILVLGGTKAKKWQKKVLTRRLTERKKGSEIRKEISCRGIRGLRGNLLQVSLRQETFSNPKNSGRKA